MVFVTKLLNTFSNDRNYGPGMTAQDGLVKNKI